MTRPLWRRALLSAVKNPVPFQVGTDATWASVSLGTVHSLALRQDGSLWAWGYNDRGQLGDGTTTNRAVPVPVGAPGRTIEVHVWSVRCCSLNERE